MQSFKSEPTVHNVNWKKYFTCNFLDSRSFQSYVTIADPNFGGEFVNFEPSNAIFIGYFSALSINSRLSICWKWTKSMIKLQPNKN